MILAIDVYYTDKAATAAGVLFDDWRDNSSVKEMVSQMGTTAQYQPGEFYKRELPCILKLIHENGLRPDCIIIDGYVYLDGRSMPALGRHLYDALKGNVQVIGVAKNKFKGIGPEYEIYRGTSKRPLYITSVGIDVEKAKVLICSMHGKYRMPTMLRRVDQLCRGL